MIADDDPVVAQALALLVPPQSGDPEDVLVRARAGAARRRSAQRRRRAVVVLALAGLALVAGAAIAASKLDLLPFLQTHDRNTARFSVEPRRTYRGASPGALGCARAGTGVFACAPIPSTAGTLTYVLVMHAIASPELTRDGMLAQLATAGQRGASRALVQRVRADLAGVSDGFIRSLNVIVSIETIAADQPVPGHPGLERVPPANVPTWVVCMPRPARTFGCRNLAASASVPVGAPIYRLRTTRDWRTVDRPQGHPFELDRLVDAVLGRAPTGPESRLLLDLLQAVSTQRAPAGSSTAPATAPATTR